MLTRFRVFLVRQWHRLLGARCLVERKGPNCEDFAVYWFRTRWSNTSFISQGYSRDPDAEIRASVPKAMVIMARGQLILGIETYWKYENEERATRVLDLDIAKEV